MSKKRSWARQKSELNSKAHSWKSVKVLILIFLHVWYSLESSSQRKKNHMISMLQHQVMNFLPYARKAEESSTPDFVPTSKENLYRSVTPMIVIFVGIEVLEVIFPTKKRISWFGRSYSELRIFLNRHAKLKDRARQNLSWLWRHICRNLKSPWMWFFFSNWSYRSYLSNKKGITWFRCLY